MEILKRINKLIFLVSISGSVVILIYLGILYFTKPSEETKHRTFLIYVIVGLILLSLSTSIPTLILSFLSVKELKFQNFQTQTQQQQTASRTSCNLDIQKDGIDLSVWCVGNNVQLQFTIPKQHAAVICQILKNESDVKNISCWGYYGSIYDSTNYQNIKIEGDGVGNYNTKRIIRSPRAQNTIYCKDMTFRYSTKLENLPVFIFIAKPETATCTEASFIVRTNSNIWNRSGYAIIDINK